MGWGVQFSFKNSNLKTDITIFRASDNLVGFWCPVNTSHTRLVLLQFCNLLERLAVKCKHVHIVVVWRNGNHCGKEGGERRGGGGINRLILKRTTWMARQTESARSNAVGRDISLC